MLHVPGVHCSHLSVEKYHILADRVMDHLLESIEELVEAVGDADQEVDYHVRGSYSSSRPNTSSTATTDSIVHPSSYRAGCLL